MATQEWSGGVGAGRVLCGERDRQLGDDRCRDAGACLEARHRTMISSNDRELPLVLCESRVTGLVRPVYKDDGSGSSRDGVVVQASPAGGLLPIWRRPIRGRHQIGSGCPSRTRPITRSGKANRRTAAPRRHHIRDGQRLARRFGRVLPSFTCRACHRSISDRSQRLGRPRPRSRTGRGISGYRCT